LELRKKARDGQIPEKGQPWGELPHRGGRGWKNQRGKNDVEDAKTASLLCDVGLGGG